ncbi:THUMP-like domain-containing protein [Sanguibacter sp. A247]|uniref:THUMP-like domain-containing protein n=1 Tax=unclassified Sanguibacter TaxID=2645534 RepID=UPI003FD72EFC
MDRAALSLLLQPEGWALLNALPPYDEATAMRLSERLRADGTDPDLVAAVLTQSRLRTKARDKFGEFADGMLFTPGGLEQATRLPVAARHAQRYLTAGVTKVADLTCGLGADSMTFAASGLRVLAVDRDEETAALATVNLRHFPEAEVRLGDGLQIELAAEGIDGIYADPARRTGTGTRVFDPRAYAPPLDEVWALRDVVPAVGIKVGPGIPHAGLPSDAEAQWVSLDGHVLEAGLWFGPLAEGPGRSVLVLRTRADGSVSARALPPVLTDDDVEVGPVGSYLFEPDGAAVRAGRVATVARELGGRLLDPTIAYITTETISPGWADAAAAGDATLATGYRVLDTMPFSLKRLKAYLREREVGRLTIKKRGTAVVPETLRKQLALHGPHEGHIVLTRVAGAQTILVVEPLMGPGSSATEV